MVAVVVVRGGEGRGGVSQGMEAISVFSASSIGSGYGDARRRSVEARLLMGYANMTPSPAAVRSDLQLESRPTFHNCYKTVIKTSYYSHYRTQKRKEKTCGDLTTWRLISPQATPTASPRGRTLIKSA